MEIDRYTKKVDKNTKKVKDKIECCMSCDHFDCQIMEYSATMIPSSAITGQETRPGGGLVGRRSYPSAKVQSAYSTAPVDWVVRN